jgi:hypothetical protein
MNKTKTDDNDIGWGPLSIGVAVTVVYILAGLVLNVQLMTSDLISIRGVEPNVVFTIQHMLLGGSSYQDPEQPPFPVSQYSF